MRVLTEATVGIARDLSDGRVALARAAFRSLLRPEVARSLIEAELTAFLRHDAPPTKGAPSGRLRIVGTDHADLRLRIVRPGKRGTATVATLTRPTMVGNAGRAPVIVRRWYQPDPFPNDRFDAARTIVPAADVRLDPGDLVALRAAFDAYDLEADDRAATVFVIGGAHEVALAWTHRRRGGRPLAASPVARSWLRLRELLTFADALGDATLVPAIAQLGEHPSHFVRWAAATSALRLAPDASLARLRTLTDDAHPQVRAAARETLARTAAR